MKEVLTTYHVSYQYPGSEPISFPDIHIHQGEHSVILGHSGSGKTTLLQLIAGLRTTNKGTITVCGQPIRDLSSTALDRFRGRNIGIIYQTSHFVRSLNVVDNIKLAQTLAGLKVDEGNIKKLLDRLGVAPKYKSKPQNCSIGEQQRIAIARAMSVNPSIILADEPTSALDDYHARQVLDLMKEQATETGASLLVVTHDNRIKDAFNKTINL